MSLFENCLMASDVDGTLVDSGYISERNLEAIKFFRSQGGIFVLSTGRSAPALKQVFSLMDKTLVGPCVVLNGGMIYDPNEQRSLYSKCLSDESKLNALYIKNNYPEIGIEVHADYKVYIMNKTDETEFHEDYESLEKNYVTFEEIKDIEWNKVLYTCNDYETRETIFKKITEVNKSDCLFVLTEVNVDGTVHPYIEQNPDETSKANALKKLCEMLNIKKDGFFAIGDYYNDVQMLKSADISAAPIGSPQDIKQLVNFVGGSCHDGAVADFIEYLTSLEVKKWML